MLLEDRKNNHLSLCLENHVEFPSLGANGFASLRFEHDALPEINKSEINLSVTLFGKKLSAPILIGAMTGGTSRAGEINKRLALAAAECGVGMALGSQRKMLKDLSSRSTYAMKEVAPELPLLIGNIGAVQLNYGVDRSQILSLIREAGCDAFAFHMNPLQECIQPEGDLNFSRLVPKLKEIIPQLGVPVLVKEVGSGISETTAMKLRELPLAAVETAGVGGTLWSKVESLRASEKIRRQAGELFARWGVPTAESIITCKKILPDLKIIASGGMRNGIEAAKAIALGADAAAYALPMLKAADISTDAVIEAIEQIKEELRITMFLTGSKDIEALKKAQLRRATDFTGFKGE
jgi:isopentenyl-diphosphate delta-isomerase